MDTKKLLSEREARSAEALNIAADTVEPEEEASDLTAEESRERSRQAYTRIMRLVWHDSRNLDGNTLPNYWHVPLSRDGYRGRRAVDASPWIDVEDYDDGRAVQVQLQTWRDQLDCMGENGEVLIFSSAEQPPVPSLWLRVRSADSTNTTDGEEVFRFPASEVTFFRGEHIPHSSEYWQRAEELITNIEDWRAK